MKYGFPCKLVQEMLMCLRSSGVGITAGERENDSRDSDFHRHRRRRGSVGTA